MHCVKVQKPVIYFILHFKIYFPYMSYFSIISDKMQQFTDNVICYNISDTIMDRYKDCSENIISDIYYNLLIRVT